METVQVKKECEEQELLLLQLRQSLKELDLESREADHSVHSS